MVLLVVGQYDPDYITRHRRTRGFSANDFEQLFRLIQDYETLWLTSYCLAEVSNMLMYDHRSAKQCLKVLKSIPFRESHYSKELILEHRSFYRLGVSDVSVVRKSKRVSLTITLDKPLLAEISSSGGAGIAFEKSGDLV